MINHLRYEKPCIKMEKEASPEQKQEIEDTITKNILDRAKIIGIEIVEQLMKMNLDMAKLEKKYKKPMELAAKADIAHYYKTRKISKKAKAKKTRTERSCVYSKEQGSYINHSEQIPI